MMAMMVRLMFPVELLQFRFGVEELAGAGLRRRRRRRRRRRISSHLQIRKHISESMSVINEKEVEHVNYVIIGCEVVFLNFKSGAVTVLTVGVEIVWMS